MSTVLGWNPRELAPLKMTWVPIQNEFCGPHKVMRSHKDDLLHPAQPAGGHGAADSHLGDVA